MATSGYDPTGNGATGDDGLDFLRSMIAEEHHEQAQVPAHAHRQHRSGSLSIDVGELHVLRGQGTSSTAHGPEAEHYDGDEDVNMLQDIADADDGGSLASYNPDQISEEDRIMTISSPPSSPVRNANGRRINNHSSSNPSRMQLPQRDHTMQISPIKRSRKQADARTNTSSDDRLYLPPAQVVLGTSMGSHPRSISVEHHQNHHHNDATNTTHTGQYKRETKRQVSSEDHERMNSASDLEEHMHRDNPLRRSSVAVEAEDGEEQMESDLTCATNNSPTAQKIPSRRTQSISTASNTNTRRKANNKGRAKSKSPTQPSSHPTQRPLPPPPPSHLIEQFQVQAKSRAFHTMAVQHLPVHIQAEAAAAAEAAVAIVAARAGVGISSTSGGGQQQLQAQAAFHQLHQQAGCNAATAIDYEAAGKAIAEAASSSMKISPIPSPKTPDKRIKQIPPSLSKKLAPPPFAGAEKESTFRYACAKAALTPPTMPCTPLTATEACEVRSASLDVDDRRTPPAHYFSVEDDQSATSSYSASSRGSGRDSMRRRVASASSLPTSSGGKGKSQPRKTTRHVKKRSGASSPKGTPTSRNRHASSSSTASSFRSSQARSQHQRSRSYTDPANISGTRLFGMNIPPVLMGSVSPLSSPPLGSPLPDMREMRVTSPPRSSPIPSVTRTPTNRSATVPFVRQHSYPASATRNQTHKALPANTPMHPQFFHAASTMGISPPPTVASPNTSANSPVPFLALPYSIPGMSAQPNQQFTRVQCWCGGTYVPGNKRAEEEHAQTPQHRQWLANAQAHFFKMRDMLQDK